MTAIPKFVLDMKDQLDRDERVMATELRVLHNSEDRCSGDLVVEPVGKEPVIVSWASVAPGVRVLFDRYVFEDVEGDRAVNVVKALIDGQFVEESRRGFLPWRHVVVEVSGGGSVTSDWTLGWSRVTR